MATNRKGFSGISNRHNIPSSMFNQYEKLLLDGYPYHDLERHLEARLVDPYDNKRRSLLHEWIKTRGTEGHIETALDTKAKRLEKTLEAIEFEWTTSGKL